MKKKKISEKENEWKGILQENSKTAYLIPSNSRTPLECKVNTNLDNEFVEEEHCNVGVNKDWENIMFDKNGMLRTVLVEYEKPKFKRVDFEFTPLTFWQLLPSVAINSHCKEIELTWLCFGMYINFKRK